ncbi:hypothetical protein BES34_016350 [Leptospira inadai serovar Lyme]|uniref:Lipoprotein n=1 Tax=Leptospira inadai serovar Lyme TaxID=293084 RepID=A0ABX4YFF6_9LEPT|nr:hypothetical protein BES34_016350 [Leptospira inadai serovar Lyme]
MKVTGKRTFLATILKSFLSYSNCRKTQKCRSDLRRPRLNSESRRIFFFRSATSALAFITNLYFFPMGNRFQNRILGVIGRFELSTESSGRS